MIQVFVHPGAPLLWLERAKEGMRMLCALRFPALMKLPDTSFELFPFPAEISLIADRQLLVGGGVSPKRLVVAEDGPNESSYKTPDQDLRPYQPSRSKVERRGAMRHHLRDVHFAPLPLSCRLKFVETRDHLVNRLCLE